MSKTVYWQIHYGRFWCTYRYWVFRMRGITRTGQFGPFATRQEAENWLRARLPVGHESRP
jgi:hypothetical protein